MRFYHNWKVYEQLPMKNSGTLPDEGFDWMPVELAPEKTFLVRCLPKDATPEMRDLYNAGSMYRVITWCECGKYIPFGKMGQHYGSGKCNCVQHVHLFGHP